MRVLFGLLLLVFYLSPFIILSYWIQLFTEWPSREFFDALQGGIIQALLSASSCFLGGMLGAMGLLWARSRSFLLYRIYFLVALMPGFLPPILVVNLIFGVWPNTPVGLPGVVFFHSLMNLGLTAILIDRLLIQKTLAWSDLAKVEGCSRVKFIFKGLLSNWFAEGASVFIFLVLIFLTSFSIPFLLAGGRYGGLELLMYEQIFLFQNWGQAGVTAILFSFLFFIFGKIKPPSQSTIGLEFDQQCDHILASAKGSIVLFFPLLFLAIGFFGFLQPQVSTELFQRWDWSEFFNSLIMGIGVGLLSLFLGSIYLFCYPGVRLSKSLFFFVPPGWMIVAFSFFLLPGSHDVWQFVKCFLAMSLIFTPFLFRFGFFQKIDSLRKQVETARTMGVSWKKVFFLVLWPQCLPTLSTLAGLAGVWACGDFALSGVLLRGEKTVALTMKNLMMNYRAMESFQLVPSLLLAMLCVFLLFQGLGYVTRKEAL